MTGDSMLWRASQWASLAVMGVLGAWAVSMIVAVPLPEPLGAEAASAASPPAPASVCDGDGRSGRRVEAIYVGGQSGADRFAALAPALSDVLARADTAIGQGRIRFVHDASCTPSVAHVLVPDADLTDFPKLTSAVAALGFSRPDRTYVLWHEGGGCGATTASRGSGGGALGPAGPVYAALGSSCWTWHATADQLARVLTPGFLIPAAR